MGTRTVRTATLPALAALLAASGAAAAGPAPAVSAGVSRTAGTAVHPRAAPGTRLWISRLPGGGGRSVAVSPDGRTLYVAGTSDDGTFTDDNFVTIAYNAATGRRLWTARYNGPAGGHADRDRRHGCRAGSGWTRRCSVTGPQHRGDRAGVRGRFRHRGT